MARIDRRRLLKLSGAGALAASSGNLAAILASSQAPAYAQGTELHWLRWSDFIPASDQLLKEQIVPQCAKALGIKLNIETVNANDIQKRITAAIQEGAGPDIFYMIGNWPQLYIRSLSDVTDVAEEIGNAQGGYYDVSGSSPMTARNGLAYHGMSSACWSRIASPGLQKSATVTANSRKPGTSTARPAKSSRQRDGRLVNLSAIPGAILRPSGIPIFGPGAAKRSNTTAKP